MTDHEQECIDIVADEDADYEEMLETYEEDDDSSIPELYFSNHDPYLKRETLPDDHYHPAVRFDDEGRIVVKNLDAWWIPEMKLVEEIDGTIYSVTGSYEGTELLDQKLTRIMLHNLEEN